jgi:hypothetical protein
MTMQTLAKELLSSKNSPLALIAVVFATALGSLASLELVFTNPASILGWLGFASCIIVYNLCFALAIGDTKNWNPDVTHNG